MRNAGLRSIRRCAWGVSTIIARQEVGIGLFDVTQFIQQSGSLKALDIPPRGLQADVPDDHNLLV